MGDVRLDEEDDFEVHESLGASQRTVRSKGGHDSEPADEELGCSSAAARALPCDFYTKTPRASFRLQVVLNAIALGLLPALLLVVTPLPAGFEEQGIFYKDWPFLLVLSGFTLGMSALLVALRVPLRYRITHTRVEVVSWARGKWWWSPCYYICTPGYSIPLTELKAAKVEEGVCLMPPIFMPPPRTVMGGKDALVCLYRSRVVGRCFGVSGLFSWTETIYLSPEEPVRMSRLLNALVQDVGRGTLLAPKPIVGQKSDRKKNDSGPKVSSRPVELPPSGVRAAPPTTTSGGPESNGVGSTVTYPQLMLRGADLSSIQRDFELTKYQLEGSETLAVRALALSHAARVCVAPYSSCRGGRAPPHALVAACPFDRTARPTPAVDV